MPKSTDVPRELRGFNEIFEKIAYRHGWSEVFCDFIDYSIACFLWEGDKQVAERLQKKYGHDYGDLKQLLFEWFNVQKAQVKEEHDWYDLLGTFYEVISSHHKSSALGQYFTPSELVSMLTVMTGGEKGAKKRMNDSCSGSGRMLISFHAHFPGNYTYAADIDYVCAKMTALNMALHGCEGQAVCMDALNPDDWRFGYAINPYIHLTMGLPHIVKIEKQQCFQWLSYQQDKKFWEERKKEKQVQIEAEKYEVKATPTVGRHGQLSFF